jgi:hypothetical protein
VDKFQDAYNQPKLNQEALNYLNNPITCNEIEVVKKVSLQRRAPNLTDSCPNFTKPLKKN